MASAATTIAPFRQRFTTFIDEKVSTTRCFELGVGSEFSQDFPVDGNFFVEVEELSTSRKHLEHRYFQQGLTAVEHQVYAATILQSLKEESPVGAPIFTLRAIDDKLYFTMATPPGDESPPYTKFDQQALANGLVRDFCNQKKLNPADCKTTTILMRNPFFRINAQDGDDNLLLHTAVQSANIRALQILRTHPDVTGKRYNRSGMTPLHVASLKGNDEAVRVLKDIGGINWRTQKDCCYPNLTALQLATHAGQSGVVPTFLADPNCRVNQTAPEGVSLPFFATTTSSLSIFKDIVGCARVQIRKREGDGDFLHQLAAADHNFASALLEKRPQTRVNTHDKYGKTPLCLAIHADKPIDALMQHPKINVMEVFRGRLPFYGSEETDYTTSVYKALTEHSTFRVNGKDERGNNPMHLAVEVENAPLLRILFQMEGAQEAAQMPNKEGQTPTDLVQQKRIQELCDVFGVKPNPDESDIEEDMGYDLFN